jgi:hypothetical protein
LHLVTDIVGRAAQARKVRPHGIHSGMAEECNSAGWL